MTTVGHVDGDKIIQVVGWQFDGRDWVGEVIGFTELLQLERDPATTRSVAVELTDKHARAGRAILEAIGIPLRRAQGRAAVEALLGRPAKVESFVADRETLEHRVGGGKRAYTVRCTVEHKQGLTYVVVLRRSAPRARAAPLAGRPRARRRA